MNLIVVGGQWPPETFIARKLESLARAGFKVTVATIGSGERRQILKGVRWKELPSWSNPGWRRAWDLARMLVAGLLTSPGQTTRIWKAAARESAPARWRLLHKLLPFANLKPDLLHFEWNFAAVQYLPLTDLMECPMVVSCRGAQVQVAPHNPERAKESELLPVTFRKAAAIHCVSRAMRSEVEQMGPFGQKIHIITPAVDPAVFCPAAEYKPSGPLRIVMTGSVIWRKGQEYALSALRLLLDRGVPAQLTIIGGADKTNRQRLLFTIHDLELQDHVRWVGGLPQGEVIRELQNSDVFLLTSLSEGISNAVLEAMSCGLPVVTTDCGGMKEVVRDGIEGFITPVREPGSVADALTQLADPQLRERMGKAGRARILAEFQLSQQTERWLALYGSLRENVIADSLTRPQLRQL